jgi:hypothetical protein
MKKAVALVAGVAALAVGGIFAGSVIGDDGTQPVGDRLPDSFEQGEVQVAQDLQPAQAVTSGKKVKILKGSSSILTVPAGGTDSVTLKCPSKHSALAAGFDTDSPGVAAGIIAPAQKASGGIDRRAWRVAVFSLNPGPTDWRAWVTCAKGVKDVS